MIHKLLKRPQAIIGLCLIAIVIVIAIAAPAFSPHDPELVNLSQKYAQPDAEYPLGTDQLGRCTLSRLLYGARYSIGISLPVLLILSVIGLIVGTFSACAGKKADHFITILCDVFIAFPSLIIAIAVIGVLGNGLQNIAVSVVIATWAWFVRVVRSYSVQEMGKDYILAARISGCNTGKLVFRHLIPNILPQFLVYVSTGVASSIIMVSSFAFLGLGLPSGTPEWGAMLNDARTALYSHPELLIYPGFMPRDIVIDSALAADRCTGCRNFTIAHEAAHQILADLFPNDYGKAVKCRGHIAYRERNGKPSWEEWQADTLAAELLMPTFLINAEIERVSLTLPNGILYKSVSDPNYEKILEMARRIGVSWSAIRIRLQQMQVIKGKPIHCHPLDIMRFGE